STRAPHTAAISVMSTVVINPDFSELLKQSTQKQNDFFAGYKDQFKTVPIVSGDENVELGDHICVHRALFTHHFICTGCNDDKIVLRTTRISQSKKPCKRQSLEVKDREYTYQQLEEKHMFKIVWPDALRRYDVSDIVKRAKRRNQERIGNSEHLVTWCICGLDVDLQITHSYFYIKDAINTIRIIGKADHKRKLMEALSRALSTQPAQSRQDTDDTATVYSQVSLVPSLEWNAIEKKSPFDQRNYLLPYQDKFQVEELSSVAIGDHLVFKRKRLLGCICYYHSALVINVYFDENNQQIIEIIQYTLPDRFAWYMLLGDIPVIKISKKTLKELKDDDAYRMQWPRKLASRFNISQVIKRAKSRDGESSYDLLKNNCQHFVTWCKCGLNASVQVEEWVVIVRTTFYTLVAAATHSTIDGIILVLSNISDDVACLLTSSQSFQCSAVGIVLEVLWALYQTYLTFYLWKKDVIKTDQFHTDIAEIWAKGACRAIGGVAGSIIGAAFGPIGSLVGGAIGAGVGHFVVTFFEWFVEDTQIRERVMTVQIQAWYDSARDYALEYTKEYNSLEKQMLCRWEEWLKPIYILLDKVGVLSYSQSSLS
ncbi:hypothetical protein QZH41_019290, partial [Actinostola sp. cb2023]